MRELKDFDFDIFDKKKEFNFKLFFLIFAILAMAIYIGFLIYGDRGISRLLELKSQKEMLAKRTEELRKENVILQKRYFELKDIEDNK